MLSKEEFKVIFNANYKDLLSYAYSYTNNLHHSEEIVQEVFLSFWENRHKNTAISSVQGYLFKAVKYKALNVITRYINKHETFTYQEGKDECMADASLDITTGDLRQILRQGIQQLPEQCRRIFLLSRFTSLTYAEIANHLEISVKTVEAQMSIALKKMKQYLLEHGVTLSMIGLLAYDVMAN